MKGYYRRDFIKTGIAAGTLARRGHAARARRPRDRDRHGDARQFGLQVTRLAFGTGSNNGHVQASLGQEQFTRLIRYAYDRGIRFFETAEAYVTPAMLGEALKGLPRDSYQLMTKVTTDRGADPRGAFDEMRSTSQTEYFDIMLLHWQHTPDWVADTKRWQDGIWKRRRKTSSASAELRCTGCPPYARCRATNGLQIAMIRMNHNGTRMDGAVPR